MKIKHILFVAALSTLLAGCIFDPEGDSFERQSQAEFTIATNRLETTRAEYEQAGTGFENYIDIAGNDFRFLIYDADGKYVEQFEVTDITPVDQSEYPSQYRVRGLIAHNITDFKLVVLANWGSYPTPSVGSTVEQLCTDAATAVFDFTTPFTPSATQTIPLYGIRTFQSITLAPDLLTDLGAIDLLRAFAKVKVSCLEGSVISSVSMDRYMDKGFCTPKAMYATTAQAASTNINTAGAVQQSLPFTRIDDRNFVIYVPEYNNTATSSTAATISVTINSITYSAGIKFGSYTEEGELTATRFDILRNHCYLFNIINTSHLLTYDYEVMEWTAVDNGTLNFGNGDGNVTN